MSNLFSVETDPQEQPAECSWGSGGKNVNSFFLRILNPDLDSRSLLMGEIFFKHCAEQVGYVHRSVVEEEQNRFRQELENVRSSLDRVTSELRSARESSDRLAELEKAVGRMHDVIEALDKSPREESERDSDTSRSSEAGKQRSGESDRESEGERQPPASKQSGQGDEGPNLRKTDPTAPGKSDGPRNLPGEQSGSRRGSSESTGKS